MANEVCEECGTRCAVGAPRCPQCSSTRLVPEEALAGLMPSLTVACCNDACPANGVERRVGLVQVVPGVLVLPRLVCARCGFELLQIREDIVAKITVHGGPSNENAEPDSVPVEETADEGGEDVSAGTSSSTSSEKEPNSPEQSGKQDPSPAPTTGSRSRKGRTGSRSASGTDGGRETGTSETNSADK